MTAVAGHNKNLARFFIAGGASLLILSPSLAAAVSLLEGTLPVQPALKISCLILFLASVNVGLAIMLDPYRRHFSRLSLPAIISMAAVVLLYIVNESLKLYFQQMSYSWLTPLVVAAGALIYAAIVCERNIPLKCLLSLDSIALVFLCALGAADRFTMPF